MKDPLQKEETPYEVLGVERGASREEILRALKKRMVERSNVRAITAASKALQERDQRALVDSLQYDRQVLTRLVPNPLDDASVLLPPKRGSTAAAWERKLGAAFPDLGIAHALAVLYYWWALYEEERLAETMESSGQGVEEAAGDGSSSVLPADEMWQRAIAYWVMIIATEEFWDESDWIPADLAPQVQNKLIGKLGNHLHELSQRYRANGAGALADRYQELELDLSTELRTAEDIARLGILRTGRGKVSCGPLVLRYMGLLETVKQQVDAALQSSPTNKRLISLQDALTPYRRIAVLIDEKHPQAALKAIEALDQEERDSQYEVSRLRVRALYERGKQQASLGEIDKALDNWEAALECGPAESRADEIGAEIVSTCQSQAAKLQRHQRDEAIAILEKGLKLVDNEKLKLTLAEILTGRGIETINDAQEKAERGKKGITRTIMAAFKRGLADLERAEALGSKRAAEQAEVARGQIEQAEVQSRLHEANEAAAHGDWNTAISSLRRALEAAGRDAPKTLKQNLAVCLANRAVQKVNRAMEKYKASAESHPGQIVQSITERLGEAGYPEQFVQFIAERLGKAGYGDNCALCSKSRSSSYGESWYSLNLPEAGTALLCASCSEFVQSTLSTRPKLSAEVAALLKSAEKDLTEAAKLDPASRHVRQNLRHVKEVSANIGQGRGARPTSTGATGSRLSKWVGKVASAVRGLWS